MTLKQYSFLSAALFIIVALFVVVVAGIHYLPAPAVPFALILLGSETLVAFELEDHKARKLVIALIGALKPSTPTAAITDQRGAGAPTSRPQPLPR